jgi:polyketide synthase PksM
MNSGLNDSINEVLEKIKNRQLTSEEGYKQIRELEQAGIGQGILNTENTVTRYYRWEWEKSSLTSVESVGGSGQGILVFDTRKEFCDAMKKNPGGEGAILVRPGKTYRKLDNSTFEVCPGKPEDYKNLMDDLKDMDTVPNRIAYLWSDEDGTLETQLEKGIYSVFHMSRILMERGLKDTVRILYIYGGSNGEVQPQFEAISGFAKTLFRENPKLACTTIEIPGLRKKGSGITPNFLAKLVMDEFQAGSGDIEVRYSKGQRYAKVLKKCLAAGERVNLRDKGVYLITGGAGGLGLMFAGYLAQKVKARLVLVGRSELDGSTQEKIAKLENLGAEVLYIKADVSKKQDVEELVAKAKDRFKNIHGVIHCAGVIRDAFIIKKTPAEMSEVLAPKVHGTILLDEALKDETLDFFTLFSSMTAVLGNAGQSDYAYANSFMDAYAAMREVLRDGGQRSGKTISINWPLWQGGGMKMSRESRKLLYEAFGMVPMTEEHGMIAFETALSMKEASVFVAEGDEKRLHDAFDGRNIKIQPYKKAVQEADDEYDTEELAGQTEMFLKEILSRETSFPLKRINSKDEFEKFGIDSVLIMSLNAELEKHFGGLPKTLFFEYRNLEGLTKYFIENHRDRLKEKFGSTDKGQKQKVQSLHTVRQDATARDSVVQKPGADRERLRFSAVPGRPLDGFPAIEEKTQDDIAIIGISGRYPLADNLDEFWRNLREGRDCITEIPAERWDYSQYYDADKDKKGKIRSKWGGFIKDVDKFDPLFFNISPLEAQILDPQERLFLQTVWETLEDSGYTRARMSKARVGVFVGVMYSEYQMFGVENTMEGNVIAMSGTYASIANRISYFFDFKGPSIALDTMCSSSLTSIHLACNSIRNGECNLAVAGGVNISIHPNKYIFLSQGKFMSSDGRCRSFGEGGDGYVPGEGVGAVLLKPLKKAEEDGDRIYCVIKATALNHGGKTNGYTVPNPNAQGEVIAEALRRSGVKPETIGYIEAHGTGTSLGDPIEIKGLMNAFGGTSRDRQPCSIGSVKSNIGHLEAAAGIAAITKVLLQMKHGELVPSLHSAKLNPNIDFEKTPFRLQRTLTKWEHIEITEGGKTRKYPRRAGVSSFGAGGSNAHVILEEYEAPIKPEAQTADTQLIVLSAADGERLREYAGKLADFLERRLSAATRETTGNDKFLDMLQHNMVKIASDILEVDAAEINPGEDLESYGTDPVKLSRLADAICREYGIEIPLSLFSEYPTLEGFTRHLAEEHRDVLKIHYTKESNEKDVGMPATTLAMSDIAYTLQIGRTALAERMAVVASDPGELKDKLRLYANGSVNIENTYTGNAKSGKAIRGLVEDGDEGEEFLRLLVAGKRLHKLAQLWVTGVDIDWVSLHDGKRHSIISLPTYPFAKERYWVPEGDGGRPVKARVSHPLAGNPDLRQSLGSGIVFSSILRKDNSVAGGMRLGKMNVFPGMAYLEIAFAAASRIEDNGAFTLEDVLWMKSMTLGDEGKEIRIAIEENDGVLQFRILGLDDERATVYMEGDIRSRGQSYRGNNQRLTVEEIKQRCGGTDGDKAVYKAFVESGVQYGSYYQVLKEVWCNESEALAAWELPQMNKDGYILHPGLMEGILQLAAVQGIGRKHPLYPGEVGKVEILQPVTTQGYIYITALGGNRFNAAVLDMSGQVCVKLHNLLLKDIGEEEDEFLSNRFFYCPEWVYAPLPEAVLKGASEQVDNDPKSVVIIHPADCMGLEGVLERLHSGDKVTRIILGSKEKEYSDSVREIDAGDTGMLGKVISKLGHIHTVYFLGGVQAGEYEMDDLEMLKKVQECGIFSLFRLARALSSGGYAKKPVQLKIVTSDVHRVIPGGPLRPFAAGINGFAKTMAKEYPHMKISCVDLNMKDAKAVQDVSLLEKMAESIIAEPEHKNGEEVAICEGKRYIRKLLPVKMPGVKNVPFKKQGVYMIIGGLGNIGLDVAAYLSEKAEAHIVILGRRKLDGAGNEKIRYIESKGGHALYLEADTADYESLMAAVKKVKAQFGRIDGVIYSAAVFEPMLIDNMDEHVLKAALAPKAAGTVNLYRALKNEKIDFVLFFSSGQSFTGNPERGHYAAGCNFQDVYAGCMAETEAYEVKTINWGFWGRLEGMSTEELYKMLEAQGIYAIKPEEGMEAICRVIDSSINQVMPFKVKDYVLKLMGISLEHYISILPEEVGSVFECLEQPGPVLSSRHRDEMRIIERYGQVMLLSVFRKMGVFNGAGERYDAVQLKQKLGVIPGYDRLYWAILDILERADFIRVDGGIVTTSAKLDGYDLKDDLEGLEEEIRTFSEMKPHIRLFNACLNSLPEILRGEVKATDVMFPGSSMELVKDIYKGNTVSDYFNGLVVQAVTSYISARLPQLGKGEKIKIVEIGAGTGGTSAIVLKALQEYGDMVEYMYTDISAAFTQYGRREYGADCHFVQFKTLNIEEDIAEQGFVPGEYDLVIAANVLHATRDIQETLENVKALLKTNGWLVLNEAVEVVDMTTLTFGLMDGWWSFKDEALRLKYAPLLSTGMWKKLLRRMGFKRVHALGREEGNENGPVQNVIAAESDGKVKLKAKNQPVSVVPKVLPAKTQQKPQTVPVKALEATADVSSIMGRTKNVDTVQKLREIFSKELMIPAERMDEDTPFADFGVDSILLGTLVTRIEEWIGSKLDPSILMDNQTLRLLGSYMESNFADVLRAGTVTTEDKEVSGEALVWDSTVTEPVLRKRALLKASDEAASMDIPKVKIKQLSAEKEPDTAKKIAVIGMACNFPGAADKEKFWKNLLNGVCSVTEVPKSRWDVEKLYSPEYQKGKSTGKWGGFIDNIEYFDPKYFDISEEDAYQTDPLMRLFLEASVQTLADAGYGKKELWGKAVGVFVGTRAGTFAPKLHDINKSSIVGIGQNFVSAHVSHFFNFKGPSIVMDTACSSSLVSIHMACQSLLTGESEFALAGGVDTLLDERQYLLLSESKALSPDGKSYTFDEKANGFVPGEGCGAVLLKRLDNALADGDRIYAVIDASAVNNDGHTMGITTPNPDAQREVIEAALKKGGIHPGTISYIEAHGTGTMIGDPIELKALTRVFRQYTDEKQFCGVGSVKTNIGHLLSAAGVASFIKTVLSIVNRQIPPTLNCDKPNPRFEFDNSPFYPNTSLKEWVAKDGIRRAGISAFGFGGTNAHIIVSECDSELLKGYVVKRQPLPPVEFNRKRYWFDDRPGVAPKKEAAAGRGFPEFIEETPENESEI